MCEVCVCLQAAQGRVKDARSRTAPAANEKLEVGS